MKNIINLIYENYHGFTSQQKVIGDFILNNFNYILYDTLSELAHKIGVSTTSIIRFSKDLGFTGYSDLQESIRNYVAVDDPFNIVKTLSNIENQNPSQIFENSIKKDIENLNLTLNSISKEDFEKCVDMISNSRKVFIVGYNDSFTLAYYMALRLGQVRDSISLLQAVGGMYPKDIIEVNEDDLLIAYFFPRYSINTLNIINWVKKNGGKVLIITSSNIEKIKGFGDLILPTYVHGGGVKESLIAPISLSSSIASAVAQLIGEKSKDYMNKAESLLLSGSYLDYK